MPPTADSIDYSTLAVGDGDVVLVKCRESISDETAMHLREWVKRAFPDNFVLVLGDGIDVVKVPGEQRLASIERKLDTLIKALADDEGEQPEQDLDGNVVGREREQGLSLG